MAFYPGCNSLMTEFVMVVRISSKLDKREKAQLALRLSLAHTLPQVLCRKTYCSALYLPAVTFATSLVVAQLAKLSPGLAKSVVDMLNLTTASGLEQ
jgi:hypothetical protein